MKDWNDEELQRMLEQGKLPLEEGEDLEAYELLFKALKKGPEVGLSRNFAANVVARVQGKASRRDVVKFYLLALGIIAVASIGVYTIFMRINQHAASWLTNSIASYKWALVFLLVSVFVIQYVDRKVVKRMA
jgi:nitrate reductase NapE component